MKKTVLLVLTVIMFSVLLVSCGGGKSTYSDYIVKDKNGDLVGYTALGGTSYNYMQDLDGNWIELNLESGKIQRYPKTPGGINFFFTGDDCTGTAYYQDADLVNTIFKTYPAMYGTNSVAATDSTKAASRTYRVTGYVVGTEKVKSFLQLDATYSAANPYNVSDEDTWNAKCVTIQTAGSIPGKCTDASSTVVCNETVDSLTSGTGCNAYCTAPGSVLTWTPDVDPTKIPLTDEAYIKSWGTLTPLTGTEDPIVITDYSDRAPLSIDAFE